MFLSLLYWNITVAGVEASSEQKKSSVSSAAVVSKPSNTSITDVIESVVSAAREDDTSKDSASSISKSGMNGLCTGFFEHPVVCHAVAARRIRSRSSERSCCQLLRNCGVKWWPGCFTTWGHHCRRWFPRSLWSKSSYKHVSVFGRLRSYGHF